MTSVRAQIENLAANLTTSERRIVSVLIADYPFAGLQSIQQLADAANVSAPSITRFVGKIGFSGYQSFQHSLMAELKDGFRSPVELKMTEQETSEDSFLVEYADRAARQIRDMAAGISQHQFDAVCELISDPSRNIFVIGGRMSNTVATMLSMYLRQIRGRVHHLPADPEIWPDYILRMRKSDVLVLFDYRRYQTSLKKIADTVAEYRQAQIVVVTDKWLSPTTRHAAHVLCVPVEIGTAWDAQVSMVTLVEALIVRMSKRNWPAIRRRIEAWDDLRLAPPIAEQDQISNRREKK